MLNRRQRWQRKLRRMLFGRPEPVYPGHRYRNHISGERFDVISIGRWVTIERCDADRRPENKVLKDDFRDALQQGFIVHIEDQCPECGENV